MATPSFGRADSSGVAFRRRQLSALQTMELPLDGDKYDSLLIFTVTVKRRSCQIFSFQIRIVQVLHKYIVCGLYKVKAETFV